MTEELKPCPFCGGGLARGYGQGPGQASFSGVELMRGVRGRRYVQCGTCGAQSLGSFHEGAAIENWNTRAAPTDPAAYRAAMEKAVEALEALLSASQPQAVHQVYIGEAQDMATEALASARAAMGEANA